MKKRSKRSVLNAKRRKKAVRKNPARMDPTRTGGLRKQFLAQLKKRFASLRLKIHDLLLKEDAFGMQPSAFNPFGYHPTLMQNTRWKFQSDPAKVKAFKEWLKQQIKAELTSLTEQQLWEKYVQEGYKKGAGRAFDDARKVEQSLSQEQEDLDFYRGTREEFLRSSFANAVSVDKVKLLAGRSFDELDDITSTMSNRIVRHLTDGLVQGQSPRDIARTIDDDLEVGRGRANVIARTEIVRAHAEGQLTALEELGVEEVGVMVEWSTAGDDRVCEKCRPLDKVVLKIEEAKNMLPRHPNAVFAGSSFAGYGETFELVRAKYRGTCIHVLTRNYRTTIGPNHPMMTARGMVKAAQLLKGDKVLYDLRHDGFDRNVFQIDYKKIPMIQDVFKTCLSVCENTLVTSSGSDLHGDREFCQGEVQAIRPARGLLRVLKSGGIEKFREGFFMRPDAKSFSVSDSSPQFLSFNGIDLPTSSSMCGSDSGILANDLRHFVWLTVEGLEQGYFDGIAFDATTASSLYCNNGFVVSNCRCAWVPANIGESTRGQKKSKEKVESAIRSSQEEGGDWASGSTISRYRPESAVGNAVDAANVLLEDCLREES